MWQTQQEVDGSIDRGRLSVADAGPEAIDFIASVFYLGEMPNFFGVYVYDKNGMVDGCEWGEDNEITEMMHEMVPALRELDQEEQSEVYSDLWCDNIWELVEDKQQQVYNDVMEYIKNRE